MGAEEQSEEREVLDSIFPEEITYYSDIEFDILINIDPPPAKRGQVFPDLSIILHVKFPDKYPDVVPELQLRRSSTSQIRSPLLDVDNDGPNLLQSVYGVAEENLGMAMTFTLISALRESAETLVADRAAPRNAAEDAARRPAGSELLNGPATSSRPITGRGTPITEEVFMKWRKEYREFLRKERQIAKKAEDEEIRKRTGKITKDEKKLTGREILERGLAQLDTEVDATAEQETELEMDLSNLGIDGSSAEAPYQPA